MPLVTALSMDETACLTSAAASAALLSTAVRAVFTAVRNEAIAARLRARCLIILRFCFSADLILATSHSWGGVRVSRAAVAVKRSRLVRITRHVHSLHIAGVHTRSVDKPWA